MSTTPERTLAADAVPVVASLCVTPARADHLFTAVWALHSQGIPVVVGGPTREYMARYREVGCHCLAARDQAELINLVWEFYQLPILAVGDALALPENFLGRALRLMEDDLRVATVSFLSNDAGFLSFPMRNEPKPQPPEGTDARSVTRNLRDLGPHGAPTPIPAAVGAAVLLAPSALSVVGPLKVGPEGEFVTTVAEFSARARERGFIHLLDDSTFYLRHRAPGDQPHRIGTVDDLHPVERHWLHTIHPNEVEFVDHEARSPTSPLGLAYGLARTKALGLRVVMDGSYLGPHEMGTQVSILATVEALSRRRDVREVVVALKTPAPPYASRVLTLPKVSARVVNFETLEGLDRCDVAHRLVQPDRWFSTDLWRTVAERVVVTVLDLIAYRNGAYHENTFEWLVYRDSLRAGVMAADAVVTISEDVKVQAEMERLPIEPQRLHAIPFGTEHLTGTEPAEIPRELMARGFVEGQFVLCLGTDYAHKNRDLALAIVTELRRRGHAHALVMAGPTVPWGSSRAREAHLLLHEAATIASDVYDLPDIESSERNWLMRHADLVLYPSSAEGFGLVPYEAASFGTPTLFTRFGPLQELAPDIPVAAENWSVDALVDAADALLRDPAQSRAQVESCLAAGTKYTWAATAEQLTDLYRRIVALAPR